MMCQSTTVKKYIIVMYFLNQVVTVIYLTWDYMEGVLAL